MDLAILLKILISFAKVGIFGYGGGPSMIPLIMEEVVDRRKWLSPQEFLDALAMGNSLPGPIATKMSVYAGYKVAGLSGAVAGLVGIVLPSAILMLVLATLFFKYKDLPHIQGTFKAVRPVIVALMAWVAYDLFRPSITSWDTFLIGVVAFISVAVLQIHPLYAIVGAVIFGLVVY